MDENTTGDSRKKPSRKSNALSTIQSTEEPSLDLVGEFVLQVEIEPADKSC